MADKATVHSINQGNKNPKTDEIQESKQLRTAKKTLNKALPTNRATVDKQLLLLRAYAASHIHSNEPVSIRQVASVAKMDRTAISLANGFFLDAGFLEKSGNNFIPTQATLAFNHAYEWNAETAPQKLAGALQNTWFAKKLTPLMMIGGLKEEDAIRELAAESGAGPEHKSQLKALLEFLEKSTVIKREGDSLVKGLMFRKNDAPDVKEPEGSAAPTGSAAQTSEPVKEIVTQMPQRSGTTTSFNQMTAGAVQFSINVKVDMNEFAGWEADRISAFFAGIAQVLAAKAKVEQDLDV